MEINPSILRAYDIRGVASRDFGTQVVQGIGKAVGSRALERKVSRVAVGRDIRLSSPRLFEDLSVGITSTGAEVVNLGVIPTPVFYFALHHFDLDTGVMITGSHNPKDQNGFKVCENKQSIFGKDIERIGKRIKEERFTTGKGTVQELDPVQPYLSYLHSSFDFSKPARIYVDPGNGTTGLILERVFNGFPALEVAYINLEPDGTFPVHLADPTVPEYMQELGMLVSKNDADLGLGFDGDGDRVGATDERGNLVFADKLLAILASQVLEERPGTKIIFDVKCSRGLAEYIKTRGGKPIMYKTGHSLLKAKLREEKAPLAGEMSGHIFFADRYFGYDDGIYAALRLLELLEQRNGSLSELIDEVPHYLNTPEIHLSCPDERKFEVIRELQADFSKDYQVITIDGARVNFPEGWGLVRASNTQPKLVLRFEAKTSQELKRIRNIFFEKLEKYGVDTQEAS